MVAKTDLLNTLPPEWSTDLIGDIRADLQQATRKLVVLDDDPTGTQTVRNVPVLTEWSVESLRNELTSTTSNVFYVLTNSRSLPAAKAQALNVEIGQNLTAAAQLAGCEFVVVSRSDSTLRGHYPAETDALATALDVKFDATLIIPCFVEGGRFTINNIHYVAEGDMLTPAAETEFAQDTVFGYRNSDLTEWVEEKSGGKIKASKVAVITIDDIRKKGPDGLLKQLKLLKSGRVCVVNAASYRDLEVVVKATLMAEAAGKRFLYRSAASFVRVRAGQTASPLLTRPELELPKKGGGLVVVGSHVPKTTSQLTELRKVEGLAFVELRVDQLFEDPVREKELARVIKAANNAMRAERTAVIYTTRDLFSDDDPERNFEIGRRVSDSLITLVQGIIARPRFMLAKGGITSSDVATKALLVRRATVRGQIMPGVPVWTLGPESRHPGLCYIVFPGNVGDAMSLADVVKGLI